MVPYWKSWPEGDFLLCVNPPTGWRVKFSRTFFSDLGGGGEGLNGVSSGFQGFIKPFFGKCRTASLTDGAVRLAKFG